MSKNQQTSRFTVLAASARLFREKGYDRTTVRDLAKAVGMQSGSLFYHFDSKGEILLEVMQAGILSVTEAGKAAIATELDPMQRLLLLTKSHLILLHGESQDALAVMLYEWRSLPPESQQQIIKLRDEYEDLWTSALEQAAEAGLISGDLAVKRRLMLGAINWSSNWYQATGQLDLPNLANEIVTLLLD